MKPPRPELKPEQDSLTIRASHDNDLVQRVWKLTQARRAERGPHIKMIDTMREALAIGLKEAGV